VRGPSRSDSTTPSASPSSSIDGVMIPALPHSTRETDNATSGTQQTLSSEASALLDDIKRFDLFSHVGTTRTPAPPPNPPTLVRRSATSPQPHTIGCGGDEPLPSDATPIADETAGGSVVSSVVTPKPDARRVHLRGSSHRFQEAMSRIQKELYFDHIVHQLLAPGVREGGGNRQGGETGIH
jgi:hypothetical protein